MPQALPTNAQITLPRYVERCNGGEEGRCGAMRRRVLRPTTIAEERLDCVQPSSVNSADLDGDSVEDLAVSNFNSGNVSNVSILWGNGGGSFKAAENFPAGNGPAFVIGADFNADLAVANQESNNVSVLLNTAAPPE